ncbi:RNA methyltransferase [Limnohabitans sp. Rim8]|uniref:TrmH family RNA methyltransferase n=1 Tax=Limnohabitans sp. Rim8 TaxID=1100718 RepID=UPI0033058B97
MIEVTSRDNPLLKSIRRLAQDPSAYRKQGKVWLEGDHLCRAALDRGVKPLQVVITQGAWQSATLSWQDVCEQVFVVPQALFAKLSSLESPAQMGFVVECAQDPQVLPSMPTVVLDRVQDAGNVGAILRSASAFGFKQVLAMKGTAALWSAKVLRAGMGAHFGMNLIEGCSPDSLSQLDTPLITTNSHQGPFLHQLLAQQGLPSVCAWVMGHEGQGVCEEIMALAQLQVRIAQPGGEESLNVASAAAICLHASASAALNSEV